jgi:glutamate/aspartate transport system substrate-binding protein
MLARNSLTLRRKKIKDTGTITLGHRESSIPFSYYDDKQQVIGYSHELMLKAVEGIKAELKLAKLDTKLMPVTSANRITLVQNGTSTSNAARPPTISSARSRSAFSTTIFVIGTKLMTKKIPASRTLPIWPARTSSPPPAPLPSVCCAR